MNQQKQFEETIKQMETIVIPELSPEALKILTRYINQMTLKLTQATVATREASTEITSLRNQLKHQQPWTQN